MYKKKIGIIIFTLNVTLMYAESEHPQQSLHVRKLYINIPVKVNFNIKKYIVIVRKFIVVKKN